VDHGAMTEVVSGKWSFLLPSARPVASHVKCHFVQMVPSQYYVETVSPAKTPTEILGEVTIVSVQMNAHNASQSEPLIHHDLIGSPVLPKMIFSY
jgi:hypothetical protein